MIGEGCYEKHMRRDAITSNVTEQVYARVHGCTRDRVHICIKYTYSETASYEATSVETSYSDNCYYRVTGLIRSIKCKGRRSKSYEHRYTIPTVLHIHDNHMSAHKYDCTFWNLQNRAARTRGLRITRDCNFIKTNIPHKATFSGWRAVRVTLGKDAGQLGGGSCDEKLTKESRKNFDASNVELCWV